MLCSFSTPTVLQEFLNGDKEYIAEGVLGTATDTFDATGQAILTPLN
jgi:tRNA U55 pseudouridine synthase TruB